MEPIDEICDLLQSHANRDKIVALTSYALKLCGASTQTAPLLAASARLASARACLRLFDDPAVVRSMIKYGLGKQEGPLWGALSVTGSVFTLAYLQAEKLVFLIDSGVWTPSKEMDYKVKTAHKLFWSLSAFVGMVRSFRALHLSAQLAKSPTRSKCAHARFTQASLTSTKLILDVIHAVSWLPANWLWGSRLTVKQASSVATLSAVLGLAMHFHGKKLAP